ncbi:EscF/YscF/HrpA family type III secretion system needle major subunit [Sutterella wadsworthensis]|jgi:hypothetical protein|uniref:EscF/YscF/HrpA family type III secretion system needle major subunit n=1 Tax=Sutterella wadsworthensis TaxID=40545 RepID=UPI001D0793D1|nr:EscF/YscF/HrpA family type III secretion system needle major subunit [Sutterella wadsworthensis]MCB7456903.1 EscF/YscF/HrpA family type III secretion system needle major subunit [Sutterella wadsworthensis]
MTSINSNLNINDMFSRMTEQISSKSTDLMSKMNDLSQKDSLDTTDMLALQFEIGQYNAMLEATSTITKSLTDEAKQIAQRAS